MWPARLRWIDVSYPTPADNLQADQALLEAVAADPRQATLRFWESATEVVVVGRSNQIDREVHLTACLADDVPILRRMSGGGAVVLGPGCLCYALALPLPEGCTRNITRVTAAIMQRLVRAFQTAGWAVAAAGVSDLVHEGRKFSGNAQRWLQGAVLHHGTVLYDFDLSKIERYLRMPVRQPAYREARPHRDFVTNLPLSREEIVRLLVAEWATDAPT
jgi:lipoate-protein ligase A